ncbi:MAG: PTS fructose transporter subunit IIA [Phycisphaerae bacterium]|nr:PTS fructose transporter subunit IIA [Phycisphaerae bacterium]
MKLTDLVVNEAVIVKLEGAKRNEVIEELLDALVAAGRVDTGNRDDYLKAIIKREKRGSTGFGHGVAVPHAKAESIDQISVAIGLCADGVDFNALDQQPVHAVFLLLSPEDRPEDHLDAMEAIFGSLSQEQFRRFLFQAQSIDDVMTLLDEHDKSQATR